LSEADIEAGERWAQSVAKELAASNFGIVCVTSENVSSPWVLFEAGALTRSLESSRVVPLLLDLEFSDISGPLAQFQAKKLTRSGIGEIVHSLQTVADQPIPEERAKQLLDALWPEFEKLLKEIPKQAPSERHVRPQHEVLEELVASVRALDARVRESEAMIADLPRSRRGPRGGIRFHPMMLSELGHFIGERPDDPIAILILASAVRDDAPWLYELGLNAYEAISGRRRDADRAVRRFLRAIEGTLRGPFVEDLGIDPRTLEMILHELPRFVDRYLRSPEADPPAIGNGEPANDR